MGDSETFTQRIHPEATEIADELDRWQAKAILDVWSEALTLDHIRYE